MDEILGDLRRNNPELLDIASHRAASLGQAPRVMMAFDMFYHALASTAPDPLGVTKGPRLFYQAVILQAANGRSLLH
jgi:hypothetical protein